MGSSVKGLDAIFNPSSVAVVGASDRPGKLGKILMHNLRGFGGDVVPISRSQERIDGKTSYASLQEVPARIDLAIVAVPASSVPDAITDAAAAKVGAAVVLAGGFAETGDEGAELQAEMLKAAHAGGVRIVGPNSFGIQNCNLGLNCSMAAGTPDTGGDIALVTQSGAYGMAIYTLGSDQLLRFSKVFAAGNKADISDAEVLAYLGEDDESSVLCFFLESLQEGRAFVELASSVVSEKPIIVTKTGRTEEGARAAGSHTAALAGRAELWRAAFEQAGVIVATTGLEMIDAAKALDWQPAPTGPRVGIVTNSGGTGVELTDLLTEAGLSVPELSPELQERLRAALPEYASCRNPVDMTPAWARFAELYPLCLKELARSGEVDSVILVLLQRSASDPAVAGAIGTATGSARRIPVYVCWVAPRSAQENADYLQERRIPCFEWPERTVRAVAHATRYGRVRAEPRRQHEPVPRPAHRPALEPGYLAWETAAELVRDFGIELAANRICSERSKAVEAAGDLGYPVVLKLLSPRFVHKADAGAVRTGLGDEAAVGTAFRELSELDPDGRVLVQKQLEGTEVVIGGYRDPQLGAMVMAGLGGIHIETLGDVVWRVAPLDQEEAASAWKSLRGYSLLSGTRGQDAVDLEGLARKLAEASRLMASMDEIAELDLNPLLASPTGVIAVDLRVLVQDHDHG